ncbi:MAG: hypothetical protein ACU0BK_16575 [Shimia sp.]|uniref:hypothetical protein n=1 Tax=Shimia sp. TaxID=1954381 RepID=UPI0040598BAD
MARGGVVSCGERVLAQIANVTSAPNENVGPLKVPGLSGLLTVQEATYVDWVAP